jgi:hypothetical protein
VHSIILGILAILVLMALMLSLLLCSSTVSHLNQIHTQAVEEMNESFVDLQSFRSAINGEGQVP